MEVVAVVGLEAADVVGVGVAVESAEGVVMKFVAADVVEDELEFGSGAWVEVGSVEPGVKGR